MDSTLINQFNREPKPRRAFHDPRRIPIGLAAQRRSPRLRRVASSSNIVSLHGRLSTVICLRRCGSEPGTEFQFFQTLEIDIDIDDTDTRGQ